MKILVTTPLYYIEGRPDLVHDTNAVHYLIKYWAQNNDVMVIDTYLNYRNHIFRYFNLKNLMNYIHPFHFVKDNVNVYLIENQLLTRHVFQKWNWNRLAKKINFLLKKEKFQPDIIISHFPSYGYGFVNKLKVGSDVKKIAILHQTDLYTANLDPKFVDGLQSNFNCCFARSKNIQTFFVEQQLTNIKNDIIYSGAPEVTNVQDRKWKDVHSRQFRILYAGKLITRKRVDWIITAVSRLPKDLFHLHIVGDGEKRKELESQVHALELESNVTFCGQLSRNEVLDVMKKSDIFCMPSENETFGLVYLEAMICGCITIGSKGEGIDGIIKNAENGYLIDSVESLEECMNYLFTKATEGELTQVSVNAMDTGRIFTEKNVSQKYYDLISK